MSSEIYYRLALQQVSGIGDVQARILIQHFPDAESIFRASKTFLERIEGIGASRASSIKSFTGFAGVEREMDFIRRHDVDVVLLGTEKYPRRLLHCYDAPSLLFYKGSADLNASRIIAIVGTRNNSPYGREIAEALVRDLAEHDVTIVSGLAYGIDAIAHKACLRQSTPTIGVIGHGLDKIYPPDHTSLAREMIQSGGGLLSEFFSGTKPDRFNFPLRNRIVAGLSDAIIVIETDKKGGSMITAKLADEYHRDVFAYPGRVNDRMSAGCHQLIQYQKAMLAQNAADIIRVMGWGKTKVKPQSQRLLFAELNEAEEIVIGRLKLAERMHVDELAQRCGMNLSMLASSLLSLEMNGMIQSLPGKFYRLC